MIRIVIAEDQQMMLGALGSLLIWKRIWKLSEKLAMGKKQYLLLKQHQPDICVMDIEMPVKTGLDVAEELKDLNCKVIILTTFARPGYFQRARKQA